MRVIYNIISAIKKTNKYLQPTLINFSAELGVFLTQMEQMLQGWQ